MQNSSSEVSPCNQHGADTGRLSPLFICGVARSGTTLMTALLDAHPMLLVYPAETYFYHRVLERPASNFLFRATEASLSDRLSRVIGGSYWRFLISTDRESVRQHLLRWAEAVATTGATSPLEAVATALERCNGPADYWNTYLRVHASLRGTPGAQCRYWVEKTPSTERFVHLIEAQFQRQARYLHVVRDPRDVVASWLQRAETATADRPAAILRIAHNWARSTRLAASGKSRCADRYVVVRYEDLARSPVRVTNAIAEAIGIDAAASLASATRHGQPAPINSAFASVTPDGGVADDRGGRFREILSDSELGLVEYLLQEQIVACGYELSVTGAAQVVRGSAGLRGSLRRWHARAMQATTRTIEFVSSAS